MIQGKSAGLAGLLAMVAVAAHADVTLSLGQDGQGGTTVIQIHAGMARLSDTASSDYLVFESTTPRLIHVDPDEGVYLEIDRQVLDHQARLLADVRSTMAARLREMRRELDALPPAEKRIVEQQMGDMLTLGESADTARPPSLTTRKQAHDEVAGIPCQRYAVYRGSEPVSRVCLAKAADAGVSGADYQTLKAMMDFLNDVYARLGRLAPATAGPGIMPAGAAEGVPVAIDDLREGRHYRLQAVARTPLRDSLFSGYRALRRADITVLTAPDS